MTQYNNTYLITSELDNYLKDNNYFDGEDEATVNQNMIDLWDTKFKLAIFTDLKSTPANVEIDFLFSKFELISLDNQGACLFFHKVIISDNVTLEFIRVSIKTVVNHNKINIYLDSIYATVEKWPGESKVIKSIFDKLKMADKQFGSFNPLSLADFLKQTALSSK